jgi:hypothetical protein
MEFAVTWGHDLLDNKEALERLAARGSSAVLALGA